MSILVIGSTNTDLIVRVARLPAAGETVLGGDLATAAGGKGANQAVAAARLGAPVTFVARLGQDMFGQQAAAGLAAEGLDLTYLFRDTAPSGVALIVVDDAGQNLIAVAPGANGRLTPADVAAAQPALAPIHPAAKYPSPTGRSRVSPEHKGVAAARVLLLQLEIPLDTVLAAARAGRAAGLIVILNPAPAQPLPAELYPLLDYLTPNEHEAVDLTGAADPAAAAQVFLQRGVRAVIVTLGAEGAVVAAGPGPAERVPGFTVTAVDTTAAGDAFNGGLAVALARGDTLPAAVRYAHAVAALSVTRPGAQPSLPTAAEVAAFLAAHPAQP